MKGWWFQTWSLVVLFPWTRNVASCCLFPPGSINALYLLFCLRATKSDTQSPQASWSVEGC